MTNGIQTAYRKFYSSLLRAIGASTYIGGPIADSAPLRYCADFQE